MTVANPTPCETAVSKILGADFGQLPERERWFVTEFCALAPSSWIAEEISRQRTIANLMRELKLLGVDVTLDDNELRQAIAAVLAGEEATMVAKNLAGRRESKRNKTALGKIDTLNGGSMG